MVCGGRVDGHRDQCELCGDFVCVQLDLVVIEYAFDVSMPLFSFLHSYCCAWAWGWIWSLAERKELVWVSGVVEAEEIGRQNICWLFNDLVLHS